MKILGGQYQPTQLYIRAGFSSPVQAPFILICTGDRAGAGYCLRVMSRPDSSETGGLLLEPGAVASTSPVIYFITAIQYSVWSKHFFFVFSTIHSEAHMHLPWQHLKGERILSSTILVFYDWMLNTWEADRYNPHTPYKPLSCFFTGSLVFQCLLPVSIRAQLKAVDKRVICLWSRSFIATNCHCML